MSEKGTTPQNQMRAEMDKILSEIRDAEATILMFIENPEIRDAVADGLVDIRRLYSNVVQVIAETGEFSK